MTSLNHRHRLTVEELEDRATPSRYVAPDASLDCYPPESAQTGGVPIRELHTYQTSFAAEMANTIPVPTEKLSPLIPAEYQLVPAAAFGLGSWDQGIVVIANFRGDNPRVDHRHPRQDSQVAIDVLILINEPAEAAAAGVQIPGAYHLYTLAIYTNDPQYAASLRLADMPVEYVPGITYDRLFDDVSGVGDVNVEVPTRNTPFYSFNTGFGYEPAGTLDTVFWHNGKHGKAVLHFHDEPFEQGQALSHVYTQPGSQWDNLLSGGGLGPTMADPLTGYHGIVTPSLSFRFSEGTKGRLMVIAPPARVDRAVMNDGSAQRAMVNSMSDGKYTLPIQADRIHDAVGRSLDVGGDGAAGGDLRDIFFRPIGDSDGGRDVDVRDLGRFLDTFVSRTRGAHCLWCFDVNNDERAGALDLVAFAHWFGSHLAP